MAEYVLNFLKTFAILLNIPKQGNLRSFYDCVYTIYEFWKYNEEKLPDRISTIIEQFYDSTYYKLIKILTKYKNEVEIKINELELEKEYCVISKTDSTLLINQITKYKSLLTSVNTLLELAFPNIEKILVILYNDLDDELSEQIMKNLFKESGPELVKEINSIYKEYSRKSFIYNTKSKVINFFTKVKSKLVAA